MRLPERIVSLWTVTSLLAHSLLMIAASPSPAFALTLGEAQSSSGRIAAGTFHSLARTDNGTVIAWGYDSEGQNALGGTTNVTRVAAGADHSLVLRSDGTVVASGLDSYGQCQVPPGLANVTAVAAGEEHSLALRSNGTVVAWGANGGGQSTVPAGLTGVVAIAAGGFHSLALKADGTVVAWGANGSGQSTVPPGLTGVVGIAAGGFHSLALRSNGTVTGWGSNSEAQRTPPSTLSGVVALAAGWRHSLALKSDGTVVAWGGGNVESSIAVPPGLNDVVAISAGWRHSLALRSDGTPVGWGLNVSGQCLGPVSITPAPNSRDIPTDVAFRITYSAPVKAGAAYHQISLEDSQGSQVASSQTLNGTTLIVTPSAALLTDDRYVLRMPAGALMDDFGNNTVVGTYYYDTLDTISPSILSAQPIDGATSVSVNGLASIEFSERIAWSPSLDSVTLISGSGRAVDCTYSMLLNRLVITPLTALEPETIYTLTVPAGAVTDLAGNPLATQFTSSFTTGAAHTITAVAGEGGSISPFGVVNVDHGANRTFTITPDLGYSIADVLVDGVSVGAVPSHLFTNVTEPHTITASFARLTYDIAPSAGVGGSISPHTIQTVGHGSSSPTFTITPDLGYRIADVLVDGVSVGAVPSHLFTNVTEPHTISASFEAAQVTRVDGATRFDVAANLARKGWDPNGTKAWTSVKHIIIANGENGKEADPLSAAGLAGVYDCPVLTVQVTKVPSATKRVITEIAQQNPGVKIHIIGGTASVPDARWNDIKSIPGVSPTKDRIAGADRYSTSAAIATRIVRDAPGLGKPIKGVILIAADNTSAFFDALAASPIAFTQTMPMLSVRKGSVPPSIAALLNGSLKGKAQYAASSASYLGSPATGATRLTTSSNVYTAASQIGTHAVGKGWTTATDTGLAAKLPDALTGGTFLGKKGGLILFTDSSSTIQAPAKSIITTYRTQIIDGWVIGGNVSVPSDQESSFRDLLN